MSAEVETMMYVREKPWHGLGTEVAEAPTSADALRFAGLDWRVEQEPVCNARGGIIPGYKANVRDRDGSVLGIVGSRYKVVQNEDAFKFTDGLIGREVRYETAGSLRGGRQIWLLAKMETRRVAGDEVEPYLCFTNAHDGSSGIKVCMTPIRVVCNNTLNLALNTAKRGWTMRHTESIHERLDEARDCLFKANKYMGGLAAYAESAADVRLWDSDVKAILDELFPVTEKSSDREKGNAKRCKDEFMVCYFAPDIAKFRGAAWGFINAASDFVTHTMPHRNTQNYADWLEYRKQGIGGSDASVVCGISKYKSPVELWLDKTGQLPPQEAGEAAYWGTQLEAIVRAEFTKRTGIEVTKPDVILQSEEHPFMLANLDGICEVPDIGTCIFEAKTASAFKAAEWEDTIPDEYALQLAHYMAVTEYAGAYIAVLIGGNTFRWKFVERDEELISMLVELETAFWNHVQDVTPPPLDGSEASVKFLSERFPNSVPKSQIALPDTAVDLLVQYDEACEELEAVTERKQKAENLLKQMLGENEVGTAGDRVITWKTISQERLDSRTLKADHPTLYSKYTSKTTYRRFSIKAAG